MSHAPRCSDAARLRGDPLIGTAPPAMRWLLVEQDTGWGREALTSLDAPAAVRRQLERALAEAGARLQLIRRPGRKNHEMAAAPSRWFVLDVGPRGVVAQGTLDDGWSSVLEALNEPLATSPGSPGSPVPPARSRFVLVCTNGRHDVCCAVRGRPVAAALAAVRRAEVWECTHTGGDRFAGNLVVLPEGVVFGALDADSALSVLDAHVSGRFGASVVSAHLRGFVGFRPPEQAARAGATRLLVAAGLPPWDRERVSCTTSRLGHDWTVTITADGEPLATVTGHDSIRPAHRLTCSATAVSRARVPVVDGVTPAREDRPTVRGSN